jgi:UDP-N-acetylmuramate: L-alanyl-gamma-D-glutamyl-meso-diaminopimelate ligase
LEHQGFKPGFLVGGIPLNFGISARLGESDFFVIEADEYDCAFFDKRSKFVHYRPRTLVMNNLEYDHADIFPDLDAIKRQFHHLVRTVPSEGLIIAPQHENNLDDVLKMGCWTPVVRTVINESGTWAAQLRQADGSVFEVLHNGQSQGQVVWSLTGEHNVYNALSAIVAAHHVGILASAAIEALSKFQNVKRRMEVIAKINGVTLYDDFAHHPTAIKTTLDGLRKQVQQQQIVAIVEPRSNTMRMGIHTESLALSLTTADVAIMYQPAELNWDLSALKTYNPAIEIYASLDEIISRLTGLAQENSHFVMMSNGSFGGIYQKMQQALTA